MRGVTQIQRGRLTPAHQHFGSATSRTRFHDATGADTREEERDLETFTTRLLTSEGCRSDCEDRFRSLMVVGLWVGDRGCDPRKDWLHALVRHVRSRLPAPARLKELA
jgi:hypothetical protein